LSCNENGLLSSVTDHAGRKAAFQYKDGRLVKAIHPSGATHQYEYDENGMIKKVIDPLGIATVNNEYDSKGRAIVQHMADGGIARMEYDDENMSTTTTEQNGNKITYFRDKYYRTIKAVYADFEENYVYDTETTLTGHTDRNNNTWWFEFDVFGNMTRRVDPLGNTVLAEYNIFNRPVKLSFSSGGYMEFTYDEYGNLTSSIDALGRQTSCESDEQGRMHTLTMPDQSSCKLEFDKRGNVIAATDSMGIKTLYEYSSLNRVVKAINGDGVATSFDYNADGSISKVTDAMGNTRSYQYNQAGMVTHITDFDSAVVEYRYNPMGQVEEIIDPTGVGTKATFDLMQNTTSVTDHNGHTIYYEYDKYNRVVKTTDKEGQSTTYEHDNNGNVTAVISPIGARTEIVYDALNRKKALIMPDGAKTQFTYDNAGNLTHVIDPLGNTTIREYDFVGQLLKITDPMGNETKFTYNSIGQPENIINPNGEVLAYSYYPGGRIKSVTAPSGESESYEYDKSGNIKKIKDAHGNETNLVYDCLGRLIESINPLGHSKKFAYDAVGHMTHATDENGNTTQYKYSLMGNVVEVIDAAGHSTKFGYDNVGRLTRQEQSRIIEDAFSGAKVQEHQITTYERNKNGQVVAVTSPLGDVIKYAYNKAGSITSKWDEEGLETLYDYNLAGNLAKVSYADGKTVEYSYNALRQLTEMRDWLGTTTIENDALGRVTKVTDFEGNQVGYTWDAMGQKEKLTYPDGKEVMYEYSTSGKLSRVISGADITSYTYDSLGKLAERILPDTTKTMYEYNPLGVLAGLTHSKGGQVLDKFKYAYDPVGNITQIEKLRSGVDADTGIFKYAYDPINRLVEAVSDKGSKTFTYDNLGNRISSNNCGVETQNLFNARNQLITSIEGGVASEFRYDKRGNLVQTIQEDQVIASNIFDATNMMVSSSMQDKGISEYAYNGFMKRVRKLENMCAEADANVPNPCKEVRYILDMTRGYDNLLMTQAQGSQKQRFVWGGGLLSAYGNDAGDNDVDGNNDFHYLQDHLGSPIRLLGADNESAIMVFDEFGVQKISCEKEPGVAGGRFNNPFGFTGYQMDDANGLYYAQARYYSAGLGRFVSEDPIRDKLNWYDYCCSNPLIFVDPSGLYRISERREYLDCDTPATTSIYGLCQCPGPFAGPELPQAPDFSVLNPSLSLGNPALVVNLNGPPSCERTVSITTAVHFTTQEEVDLRNLAGLLPFGVAFNASLDSQLYVGGASITTVSWYDIAINAVKYIPYVGKVVGGVYLVSSIFNALQPSERASMDMIIQGYFTRNGIPTSHTVVTHACDRTSIGHALLQAQMTASDDFIRENSSYFLNRITDNHTLHQIDMHLMSLGGDTRMINGFIDHFIAEHRRHLGRNFHISDEPRILLIGAGGVAAYLAEFRAKLENFHERSNWHNMTLLREVSHATCSTISQVAPHLTITPLADSSSDSSDSSNSASARFTERNVENTRSEESEGSNGSSETERSVEASDPTHNTIQ